MIRKIGCIVTVLLLSFGGLANGQMPTSNDIPSQETFENRAAGTSIIVAGFTNGWCGNTNSMTAIVSNRVYGVAGQNYFLSTNSMTNVCYPVAGATHTNVLAFTDAAMTNQFDTYDTSISSTNITVDFMIQPIPREEGSGTILLTNQVTGCQTAMYVDSNGFLNVWYGITEVGDDNAWMTFTNVPRFGASDWARITVEFDYTSDASGNPYFTIKVNGITLIPTNNLGYVKFSNRGDIDSNLVILFSQGINGDWLRSANPNAKQIHSFAINGSGMLDDFVITTNIVNQFYPISSCILYCVAIGNGTIMPTNAILIYNGSTNFSITAANYYRIGGLATITTNGTNIIAIPFDNNSTNYNFDWINVQTDGALVAQFIAQVVTNNQFNTPYWWLSQYGLNNFAVDTEADQDNDGMVTWQEYIAGTIPTNANSVLKLINVTSDGTIQTLKWLSSTGALYNYSLYCSTNLSIPNNGWICYSNNIAPNIIERTNSFVVTPPRLPIYYKITVE